MSQNDGQVSNDFLIHSLFMHTVIALSWTNGAELESNGKRHGHHSALIEDSFFHTSAQKKTGLILDKL